MDFFGVGIGEILFILGLGFIILGPERLQDMGRSAGRLTARVLAWQHQSPEAQLVQQMRKDFEHEIIDLRDEIIRAKQQLDVSAEVRRLQEETSNLLNRKDLMSAPPDPATPSPPGQATTTSTAPTPPGPVKTEDDLLAHLLQEEETRRATSSEPAPPAQPQSYQHPVDAHTVPRQSSRTARPDTNGHASSTNTLTPQPVPADTATPETDTAPDAVSGAAPESSSGPPPPAVPDPAQLSRQLETLMNDLQALQEHLRLRGLLDADWQAPSQSQAPTEQHEQNEQHETTPSS